MRSATQPTDPGRFDNLIGGGIDAELRRSDFGLRFVGNAVRLKVQVEGVRVD